MSRIGEALAVVDELVPAIRDARQRIPVDASPPPRVFFRLDHPRVHDHEHTEQDSAQDGERSGDAGGLAGHGDHERNGEHAEGEPTQVRDQPRARAEALRLLGEALRPIGIQRLQSGGLDTDQRR
jgi:hypothetical protein